MGLQEEAHRTETPAPLTSVTQSSVNSSRKGWQDLLTEEVKQFLAQGTPTRLEDLHNRVDRVLIAQVLQATDGNISETSIRLGISRPTLRNRIRQLRLGTEPPS